ncbi:hypothetical protein B0T26DRAFT_658154, partial [Lasiosphaeria miniovina]
FDIGPLIGGGSFLCDCTIANNGYSLSTSDVLMDTGADGYILRGVADYRGKSTQEINQLVRDHLRIQGRTVHNEWMIVLEMKHDLLIGKNWFAHHDVWLDCAKQRLMFPSDWDVDPGF